MRPLSSAARRAIFAQETDEVFLIFLVIDHESFTEPIRVVHNDQDVTIDDDTYLAYPFIISLPPDRDDELPEVTLRIDNVDQLIIDQLQETASPPTISLTVRVASQPDTIEAGPFDFSLRDVTANVIEIIGTLGYEAILEEPFPGLYFTPKDFPGLFQQ